MWILKDIQERNGSGKNEDDSWVFWVGVKNKGRENRCFKNEEGFPNKKETGGRGKERKRGLIFERRVTTKRGLHSKITRVAYWANACALPLQWSSYLWGKKGEKFSVLQKEFRSGLLSICESERLPVWMWCAARTWPDLDMSKLDRRWGILLPIHFIKRCRLPWRNVPISRMDPWGLSVPAVTSDASRPSRISEFLKDLNPREIWVHFPFRPSFLARRRP